MKIKNLLLLIRQLPRSIFSFVSRRRADLLPPPVQLDLELDQLTDAGLPLRDAIPVRSAEYWLQMGEPNLALKKLETLPETAHRHSWPSTSRRSGGRRWTIPT